MLTLVGKNLSRPWNKGLLVGQKKAVWSIRVRLEISRKWRDLALFNLAIDSKLRRQPAESTTSGRSVYRGHASLSSSTAISAKR
jgi:hypothetical protein